MVLPFRLSMTCVSPVSANREPDELGRCLAVEGAAALLQQLGLLGQRRIAIELEQLALDLGDHLRSGNPVALLGEHPVVLVEVAKVVGGDGAELGEQLRRGSSMPSAISSTCELQQAGQRVVALEPGRPHPGQVVEADLVDRDPVRRGTSRSCANSR